jgi:AraC-like DNA-binding protein
MSASPGDIVFMPKRSIYTCSFHSFNDTLIKCNHLGFTRSCLFFGFDVFNSNFEEIIPHNSPRILFRSEAHDFTRSFIRLCKVRHRPDYTPSQLCIEAMQFINLLSKKLNSAVRDNKDEAFFKIIDYIHNNLETVTSGELANITDMSVSTIQRRFSEKLSMTPTAYINRMKIEKAKDILESGMTKIKEVCHLCGIEDEFYFSRLFSKYVGMSPTEYRKSKRKA